MESSATTYMRDISNSRIMGCIFEALLEDFPAILPPSIKDPRYTIQLVCKNWREILLSTSSCWKAFAFIPKRFNNSARLLQIFEVYIRRSGSCRLGFYFLTDFDNHLRLRTTNPDLFSLGIEQLVYGRGVFNILQSIILPYAERIQHLQCLIYREQNAEFLLGIKAGWFKLLESVNIIFINDFDSPCCPFTFQQSLSFEVFTALPNFRQATVRIMNNIHPLDLHLPFNQLVKLDLVNTPISCNTFIKIMRQSALSLMDGAFHVELGVHANYFLKSCCPLLMLNLAHFHIRIVNPNYYPDIVLLFRFPVLRRLRVERSDRCSPFQWDVPRYTTMLATSTVPIETLVLANCAFGPGATSLVKRSRRDTSYQELEELLALARDVHTLVLPWSVHVHLPTIQKIATGALLPRLQVLEFSTIHPTIAIDMVRERNERSSLSSSTGFIPPAPIIRLGLTVPSDNPEGRAALKKNAEFLRLPGGVILNYLPMFMFSFAT
ncbi:hypothetical protein GALMADRAFT_158444 [Galerina marginata CBS 339.88]|uniref:F-box domain-containing protein n=1 Tax=Galerina marginata (strain CBS 339.88) TaxID=685588 RepID=A0A067STL4_GALM3|nr:hypothetical protein GALMADRAFT_158444 [Galerina marginata CBS 339.88]